MNVNSPALTDSHGSAPAMKQPLLISVIVLNYDGAQWLSRCFDSLVTQTFSPQIEIIVVDNNSPDGSGRTAALWVQGIANGRMLQNKTNLYFCEANNRGAELATGEFLFFLNNDLWLEVDCLEKLYEETKAAKADAATPLVLNYNDNTFQSLGGAGLDFFGLANSCEPFQKTREIFCACGCSLLIKSNLFKKVGGFDAKLLMYADEVDLSWRVWIAGGKIVGVPSARLHHRGAAAVNPKGETEMVESRTSETKRFLANRNNLLVILKNSRHILLLLLIPHLLLLLAEAVVSLILVRRWSFVRKSYFGAVAEAFGMFKHVADSRRSIQNFRRRSDFWMLRFLKLKPSRWVEIKRLLSVGIPKVDAS
jgi:GT2 family glycosyltransferase